MIILGSILFSLIFATSISADIGFINYQIIYDRYVEAVEFDKKFQEKRTRYEEKLAEFSDEIQDARDKNASEKKIEKLTEAMEKEMTPLQQELIQMQNESLYAIRQKIAATAQRVATEQGLSVILNQEVIVYCGYDITAFVLDKLNRDARVKSDE